VLRVLLLAVLLLGFELRVHQLGAQELRGDEAFGYFFSQRPFGEIVTATVALAEPHPVGSYFVQKAWIAAAGDTEFALRFVSAWFSVLAVALLYRLARRLDYRSAPALAAAGLLALSPYAVWHAQDARMYSMSLALTIAAVWLGLEAVLRQRWWWAAGYIATAFGALHTHYYAAFVLLALNIFMVLWLAYSTQRRARLLPWLLWQVIVGALYLPWLVRVSSILGGYGGNGDSPGLWAALGRALAVFAAGESAGPDSQGVWMAAAGLLMLLGVVRLAGEKSGGRRNLLLLGLYLLLPLLATWWSAQARPIFNERYLVAALPPFYLLVAAAFAPRTLGPGARSPNAATSAEAGGYTRAPAPGQAGPMWMAANVATAVLAGVLLAGMSVSLLRMYGDPAYSKTRGWRELAAAIEEISGGLPPEQVRVAQNFPDPTLWYYYRGPVEHTVLPPQANDATGARAAVQLLASEGVQRVLLPVQPAANWDADGLASAALDGWYDRAAQKQVGVWPVQVYAEPAGALAPVGMAFGARVTETVTLRGYVAAPDVLPPGGLLSVHLDWTEDGGAGDGDAGDGAGADPRQVFVQLLDGAGQLVAQDDRPLVLSGPRAAGSGLAVYGLWLPQELANGPYRLIAGVYDPMAPGAPRLPTAEGGDHVTLQEYLATTPQMN
jgi:hypothetical protein